MEEVVYSASRKITAREFIDLLRRSGLGERRPIADEARIEAMVARANLICTAWAGGLLVGVARGLTDFSYCCYLSDLAVDASYQRRGIGSELLRQVQQRLHPEATLILLAAPASREYYPRLGMLRHDSAWTAPAGTPLGK